MVTWSYRSRESEFFPAYPSSLGLWTPKDKRSIMQALECLGVEMGLMISDWLPCSDDLPGVFFVIVFKLLLQLISKNIDI